MELHCKIKCKDDAGIPKEIHKMCYQCNEIKNYITKIIRNKELHRNLRMENIKGEIRKYAIKWKCLYSTYDRKSLQKEYI